MKRLDIANVFATKEPNDVGIAALNMYLKGKPTIVTIDDTVPVDADGNPVLALLGSSNAIWPLLIEKAFAKMYGNFENIVGGWTQEGTYALTGYPQQLKMLNEWNHAYEMFDWIEASLDRGDILSIGTAGFGDDTITNEFGLVMSHAYTVIDTYRLTSDGQETHRLIKMRNPWGAEYYDGRWCDYCPEWNSVYENRVDLVNEDDGIIFIEDKDL